MKQQAIYTEINENGTKFYYSDRKMTRLHRTDGPAIEWSDGTKEWWQNGQLHRTDGPAIEYADGSKSWWQNGQRHRTDGPAVEWSDGRKAWYIDDVRMSEAEFRAATATKVVHELTLDDIAARLGIAVESLKIVKEQ